MSITLFCLVKGRKLKDAIKVKKAPEFDSFPADKLKLCKVEISDDHNELLATREIEDYWSEKPAKRHIHVLVKIMTLFIPCKGDLFTKKGTRDCLLGMVRDSL
ncbi:hypothetical protein C1646_751604 [Rhizophagus diaphanus]|nr:hypothetical protein C1646_751604 [Rhizophagus diaphanus] [Rhizophagus sp. MUCL 43196]